MDTNPRPNRVFDPQRGYRPRALCAGLRPRTAAPQDKQPIPSDFKIVARYVRGYSSWKSWETTITSDGKVVQEILASKDAKKRIKLAKDDMNALLALVNEANFSALKERYDYLVTDNPTLILTITMDKKTHKVSVYAPAFLEKNEEVERFLKVWSEVLRKVPSPNPGQKP